MNYLVCYDICNHDRLRRVAKTLERYGIRVQYSFFNVDASQEQIDTLIKIIMTIINQKEDKLYVYPICNDCKKKIIIDGKGAFLPLNRYEIL